MLMPKNAIVVWMIEPAKTDERSVCEGVTKQGSASIDLPPETWLFLLSATFVPKTNNLR